MQVFHQFTARVDGVFERGFELDGLLRAHFHAELAEHTATQIIPVFYQYLFLLAGFIRDKFGRDFDGPVRAVHLADAAGDAFVVIVLVVRHYQFTPETVKHFQRGPVFRVLLRRFLGEKFP